MGEWVQKTLGEVLTLQRGFDLPERMRKEGEVPIVSSSGVRGFHSIAKVKGPGVVTGRYGTLGEVFYLAGDFWPLNTTLWVKEFKGNDPRFISFLLRTLNLAHQNAAGAVPGVNRNALHLLPVRIPSPPIQHHIASILSAYDDLIEKNTRRIKLIEEMAQRLYREWFVNFRFPGHGKGRVVESELGPIPEGWKVQPLEQVVEEFIDYRGKTPKKLDSDWSPTGILALSALNVKQGCLVNLEKAKRVDENLYKRWMKCELRAGDILMTSEAPLGEVYFLPETRRYCLSQRVFGIRADATRMQASLLFFALSSPEGQKQLKSKASGTTVSGIRQADLRRIPVLQAPKCLQETGDSHLRPFLGLVDAIHRKTNILRTNRKRFSAWFRKLVAQKFDGSKYRLYPGRPATSSEVVNLIVQLARENSSWGYDRIAGALTVEVLTWRGLVTYYVLFLIQPETRKVILAGITRHPTEEWMQQLAQNLTDSESGALIHQRYKGVSVEADPI